MRGERSGKAGAEQLFGKPHRFHVNLVVQTRMTAQTVLIMSDYLRISIQKVFREVFRDNNYAGAERPE